MDEFIKYNNFSPSILQTLARHYCIEIKRNLSIKR